MKTCSVSGGIRVVGRDKAGKGIAGDKEERGLQKYSEREVTFEQSSKGAWGESRCK